MVFYGGEDPATGSAAGPAAAWMLRHGWIKTEQQAWIEQGVEIFRPSQILVRSGGTPEKPANVRVGGFCHGAINGELLL
jgi:trans-2,3-dihydro-3-hydroxyanthranilate isomerase